MAEHVRSRRPFEFCESETMTPDNHNKFGIPFLSSDQIRQGFFDFYAERDHTFVRSAPVFLQDDPTLLFINSGMNQFKPIFLGENSKGLQRVYNSQKCLRVSGKHNDLDEVGRDNYHHTFFEMLGHWSFGDYYKKESITWAWHLLTEVWKLPKDRLFATVYKDDDESEQIWKEVTDISHDRIMRFDSDNFWEMGAVGPCGPCTEIHFDLGPEESRSQTFEDKIEGVNGENHRYVELFNVVFIQNERLADGSLIPLKEKHVDTGAGFERICSVIQGTGSNYETDIFTPVIERIAELSKVPYDKNDGGTPHRVIADHLRALSFAIADGATPGNEGRGYVLRRILRRASKFAHSMGQKEPFIYKLVSVLVKTMGEAFPEIKARQKYIEQVILAEESRFLKTLDSGLDRMNKLVKKAKKSKSDVLAGEDVFMLYDTFGFPSDLTALIAEEQGLKIDHEGYEQSMEEQRERARSATKFDESFTNDENWTILNESKETNFLGYEKSTCNVVVNRFIEEGEKIYVVLNQTPFYAEAGGQVSDIGKLRNENLTLSVIDVQKVLDMTIHTCELTHGLVTPDNLQSFEAEIDTDHREKIKRNHSATHLLHAALRDLLGDHVTQQGSLVDAYRLRFDFTHHQGLTVEERLDIENWVNSEIQSNHAIKTEVLGFKEAKKKGAMALFGEKYGDTVRVLEIGPKSLEFCGGTHARETGQIGVFKIVSESSVAAGVRRVEAIAGMTAVELLSRDCNTVNSLSTKLKVKPNKLEEKVVHMQSQSRALEKELKKTKEALVHHSLKAFVEDNKVQLGATNQYKLVSKLDSASFGKDQLQYVLDTLSSEYPALISLLTHVDSGAMSVLATSGRECVATLKANELVSQTAKIADGRGGGRPDKARAGAKSLDKELDVLREANRLIDNSF